MNLFKLLRKTANTIRYNGLYIFLAIIFPLILIKFDAGRDIFESLAEEKNQLSFSLCLVAFFILGYTVWCIPTLATTIFQFFTGYKDEMEQPKDQEKTKERLFASLIEIYNDKSEIYQGTTQFPIRWFAVLPWILFVFAYYSFNGEVYVRILQFITLILFFKAGHFLYNKYATKIKVPREVKLSPKFVSLKLEKGNNFKL